MKETAPLGCLLIFVSLVIFFGWAYVGASMSPELVAEEAEAEVQVRDEVAEGDWEIPVSQYDLDQQKVKEWVAKNWSSQKWMAIYKEWGIEYAQEVALREMNEAKTKAVVETTPTRWGLNQTDWMTGVVAIWAILFVACCFGLGIGAFLIHDNGPDVLAVLGVYMLTKKPCYEKDEND
jgi:hypothetical protein